MGIEEPVQRHGRSTTAAVPATGHVSKQRRHGNALVPIDTPRWERDVRQDGEDEPGTLAPNGLQRCQRAGAPPKRRGLEVAQGEQPMSGLQAKIRSER